MQPLKNSTLLALVTLLLTASCGNPVTEAESKLKELKNKAQALDSLVNQEIQKVNALDSLINKESEKVKQLDTLIQNYINDSLPVRKLL